MKSTHHLLHSNTCRIQIGEYQWFEDFDFAWSVIVFETIQQSLRIDISDAQNGFLFFEFITINFELVSKFWETHQNKGYSIGLKLARLGWYKRECVSKIVCTIDTQSTHPTPTTDQF